jgi:hypothetical protein
MAPFSFQKGRKVFNGAIVCNFHFLFIPMQYKGQIPPKNVTCNIRIRTIECKKNMEKLKKSSLRGCIAVITPKVTKLQKSFLGERRVSFEAQKSFLRE